ncbi:phage tail tip lysozyme [Paracoccus versutus]
MAGYIFGGNTGLTYQDMLRQRQQAQQMQAGIDKVQGPGGGLNALAKGFAANILNRRANAAEKEGMEAVDAQWNQQFGGSALGQLFANRIGGGSPFADGVEAAAPQQSQPQFAPDGSIIRQGLVERGLPEHIADAFVLNFQDESGLNPGINEKNPVVPGSRGGFGLAQWTGPRRRQLEAFAAQRGTPVSDLNTQLDFLMTELQGPESRAAQSILSAQDTPTAAAAIVNNFLRPAEEHRARREAAYLGGQAGGHPAGQGGQPMGMDADMAQMAALMSNPFLDEGRRSVLGALMQQRMAQQNAVWEQQQAMQDPYRMAQLEQIQLQNEALRNPPAPERFETITGEQAAAMGLDPKSAYNIGPDGKITQIGGGGVTVNMGGEGQRMGGIPSGYTAVEDSSNPSGFRLEAIPGGPAAAEAQQVAGERASAVAQADQILSSIDGILNDPALEGATGWMSWRQRIPGTESYRFGTRARQLEGQAFLQAFEALKGGGAITEIEGQKATQAIGRLDTAQSAEDYRAALNDLRSVVSNARIRASGGTVQEPLDQPNKAQGQRLRFNPETGDFE